MVKKLVMIGAMVVLAACGARVDPLPTPSLWIHPTPTATPPPTEDPNAIRGYTELLQSISWHLHDASADHILYEIPARELYLYTPATDDYQKITDFNTKSAVISDDGSLVVFVADALQRRCPVAVDASEPRCVILGTMDVETGQYTYHLFETDYTYNPTMRVAVSADGSLVAFVSSEGEFNGRPTLLDVETGMFQEIAAQKARDIALSADGEIAAYASYSDIVIVEVATGEEIDRLAHGSCPPKESDERCLMLDGTSVLFTDRPSEPCLDSSDCMRAYLYHDGVRTLISADEDGEPMSGRVVLGGLSGRYAVFSVHDNELKMQMYVYNIETGETTAVTMPDDIYCCAQGILWQDTLIMQAFDYIGVSSELLSINLTTFLESQ